MKIKRLLFVILVIITPILATAQMQEKMAPKAATEELKSSEKLVILWTSGDKEVAEKMVFMYTFNSKRFKWWEDITLVVWGPSAKLLSEDVGLQEYLKKIMDQGTVVKACKGCADMYGVSEKLEELGITVKYMSEFTDYIKEGRHVLTI